MAQNVYTYSNNINFTFPTKYYDEAYNCMVGIGLYLNNKHEYSIMKLFSPLEKERIRSNTWNQETGEPVLDIESMASNTLEKTLEDWLLGDITEEKEP